MKPLLPSGRRRGLSFLLPDDWTPEQALAAYELLDDLLAVIGDFYGIQLHEQLRQQRTSAPIPVTDDPLDPF
ncbi:hypothetical protein I6G56_25720 [Burkholderia humptydooensis]|uniref:Uncharacterized protein n=2 Tax=Burkholderia humptydooensis TaxID=430531 RepID=A0A7U4P554_9BURK|nr:MULTISPECIES: hypothetical protein [Burkholderia]AJY40554.1 hypothetical protein BW21_4972 [Burkholderia sp. 2002721687]AJY43584.1 hypothetical protein BW21_2618 [Burkholderia sp. 2002721687]ALX43123.1 hypothetical protein AQ610_12385 [Burkholderia humptydooensis]ALX46280.1 hypothetical protein AQ610_28320 [Burkholderia humptydooensis]EIP84351.1 hypothetical protein A33K_18988 [Burkholderia humptydooensis MSMB43]